MTAFHNPLEHCEPDSGTFRFLIKFNEQFENPILIFRFDSHTVVFHEKDRLFIVLAITNPDMRFSLFAHIFYGVFRR